MASNLTVRIVSALVMAPLAIGAVLWSYYSFLVFVALACMLMIHEWNNITKSCGGNAIGFTALALAFVAMAIGAPELAAGAIGSAIAVRSAANLLNRSISLWPAAGIGYIGLAGVSLMMIHGMFGAYYVLWLLVAVWGTDIGGYAFGKSIGGPKLAPSISPGKTWAGLVGGMIFAAIVGAGFGAALFGNWLYWALASALIAVVAQIGDLLESKLKRIFGVKDSGSIIPGHGGVLDRLDGVLLAAPVSLLVLIIIRQKGLL